VKIKPIKEIKKSKLFLSLRPRTQELQGEDEKTTPM